MHACSCSHVPDIDATIVCKAKITSPKRHLNNNDATDIPPELNMREPSLLNATLRALPFILRSATQCLLCVASIISTESMQPHKNDVHPAEKQIQSHGIHTTSKQARLLPCDPPASNTHSCPQTPRVCRQGTSTSFPGSFPWACLATARCSALVL